MRRIAVDDAPEAADQRHPTPYPEGVAQRASWYGRLGAALWALSVLVLLLARLGAAPLFDVDEGAFAEATREMVASGDYGFPTLDGAPRFDKPILIYWLQAASVHAFGVNEWALRLPSALSFWLWSLAVAWFVGQRWGRRAGLIAGTVLATSAGPMLIGRACTADGLLNLFLALTLFDGWRHLETGRRAPLLRAYVWIGLGLLTKGPIAVVIPAAVSLLHLALSRTPRRWLRLAFNPEGWLLLVAIAGPWYGYALHRHGMAFVNGFLVKHNIARYTSTLEHHGGSLFYYLLIVPVLLLPWSALLPSALSMLRRGWRGSLDAYLLAWGGFVVVFFSLSGTKLPHYALYGSTPLVLGLAVALERSTARQRRWVVVTIAVLLCLLMVGPQILPRVADQVSDRLYAALLREPSRAWPLQVGAGLALGCLLAMSAWNGASVPVATGGAAVLALVLGTLATPWLADTLQSPVKNAALAARAVDAPVVQWDVRVPSFSLYRGAPTPRAAPRLGQLAITREDRLEASRLPFSPIYRERGYALVRVEQTNPEALTSGRTSSAAR